MDTSRMNVVSYVCGLNSDLFQYTDKNDIYFFLLETNKCRKAIAFFGGSVHVYFYIDLAL